METVIRKLLAVVEHLAYSHTFRSEAAGNEVRKLLAEARADLEPAPAAEAPAPVETPTPAETPAETPAPAEHETFNA